MFFKILLIVGNNGENLLVNYLQLSLVIKIGSRWLINKSPPLFPPLKSTLDELFEYELGLYCIESSSRSTSALAYIW